MNSHPTKYWHKLDDGRIQCDVCPRYCKMHEGQRGLCFVRGVEHGAVVLTSYGVASGFCIDPIEKKPLNHFLPGTPVLSFGQWGCNLTCSFCQNHDISKTKLKELEGLGLSYLSKEREQRQVHTKFTPENHTNKGGENNGLSTYDLSQNLDISKAREFDALVGKASPQDIARAAVQWGCKSVAFTYNDPVIFLEYAVDTAVACHELGVKTVAVTAGYIAPEARKEFFSHMDAANIDLKGFSEDFYHRLCGAHLQEVLDTLMYLKHETNVWFEMTNLLIPGENDSVEEIDAMTKWVVKNLGTGVPMHFSVFHPDWKMLDKPRTPEQTVVRARAIALKNGVKYAYVGNVHNLKAESTYCSNCGICLIARDWYELSAWRLTDDGRCVNCGQQCGGTFDGPPGTWGAKRQPIQLYTKTGSA